MAANSFLVLLVMGVISLALFHVAQKVWVLPNTFDYALAHKDEFEVIFAGSSFTLNHVDPRVFDEAMAERGYRTNSYNIARGGSSAHESNYLLRRLVRHTPERLVLVITDFQLFELALHYAGTMRFIEWHDIVETRAAIRTSRTFPDATDEERREAIRTHRGAAAARYTPLGKFFQLQEKRRLWRQPNPAPEGGDQERIEARRGYRPLRAGRAMEGQRERYEKVVRVYERRLAMSTDEVSIEGHPLAHYHRQREWLEREGVHLIHVSTPALYGDPLMVRRLADEGALKRVLLMDDLRELPSKWFEPDNRHDVHHLGQELVPEYTRELAFRLADMIESDPELDGMLERIDSTGLPSPDEADR
jgi:hypothetical protein